jgi:hypothetical protein
MDATLNQEIAKKNAAMAIEKHHQKLVLILDDLTKNYRALLEIVRKEKECLVHAEIEELSKSNKEKEILLHRLKSMDVQRDRCARELAHLLGANDQNPRLLELALKCEGQFGNKLRTSHATLELLIKRITELNKENEIFAKSALDHLNGAMNNIKDSLAGAKGYEKRGRSTRGFENSGNIVRKEI